MTKLSKRVNQLIGGMILAITVIAGIYPVYASGNTTNYNWYGNAVTPGENIWYPGYQTKYTDSSIRVKYNGTASEFVGVRIYAAIDGGVYDVTYNGPYICYASDTYYTYVQNLAYENNHYSYVSVRPVITTTTAGYHSASWIPDV